MDAQAPFTRYNLLSNRLSIGFDNRLYRVAGCQTGCTTRFDNRLNEQWLFVQHGTGWMLVYTIQQVVKPVVQPVVSCKRGISLTSDGRRLNEVDNTCDDQLAVAKKEKIRRF